MSAECTLTNELSQNFIEYAAAVNTDRAIPNAKDGLKPVAKRILYGAYATGRTSNKAHVKCARIVGDVMGSWHPHGDSSIYGALVRLAQDWVMRYPLIDFHGNMGNIGGDGPAAYRYTEARLSKLAEDGLLFGIKKENVDFIPNYDETTVEPVELPAIFPNLLCNPNTGIGVAMACSWLPHNLREVTEAIIAVMYGREPTLPGPDFPTGGQVINKNDLPEIIRTGHGTVKLRARYKVEKQNLVFYEVPYGVTTETLLTEIGELCEKSDIEGITEIRDESNKKGIRIVFQCAAGQSPDAIAQRLYAKTDLQTSISYNQVALVDKIPTELGLKDCIDIYLKHNVECIIKEATNDLKIAEAREEIVEGLLRALVDIDDIIALIKRSESSKAAQKALIEKYKFTENQAKAIVNMRLGSLASLEKVELNDEHIGLLKDIERYKVLITSREAQYNLINERLTALTLKYGDERRTELTQIDTPVVAKEIINVEPEKCVVLLTESGLIKRIPHSQFKVQKRNGVGIKNKDGIINSIIRTNTIDSLMVFTNKGKMYRILVNDIPEGNNTSKGVPLKALIEMDNGEEPTLIYSIYHDTDDNIVLFVTKQGIIKKTYLEEYVKTRKKSGLTAISLRDGDELISVSLVKNDDNIILLTKNGMAIHMENQPIGITSRVTLGVKGITLGKDDEVIAAVPVRDKTDDLAIFAQSGMAKRVKLSELPTQQRGGKGLICYKTGNVVGGIMVNDSDNILLSGVSNSICINAKDISIQGRAAAGVQMIKSALTSVSKV